MANRVGRPIQSSLSEHGTRNLEDYQDDLVVKFQNRLERFDRTLKTAPRESLQYFTALDAWVETLFFINDARARLHWIEEEREAA